MSEYAGEALICSPLGSNSCAPLCISNIFVLPVKDTQRTVNMICELTQTVLTYILCAILQQIPSCGPGITSTQHL